MKINRKKLGLILVALVAIIIVGWTGHVSADTLQYTPLAPLPGIGDLAPNGVGPPSPTVSSLPDYLVAIFKLTLGLAAVMAVVQITIGGVEYMSTDAISGKENGKERITQAIYGLLLAIGAWLILYTVNPKTLDFSFNPNPTVQSTQTNNTGSGTPQQTQPTVYFWEKRLYCIPTLGLSEQDVTPIKLGEFNYENGSQTANDAALTECQNATPSIKFRGAPSSLCPTGTAQETINCGTGYRQ